MNAQLKLIKPANQNRSVHPTRPPNAVLRTREHLLPAEIDKLIAAARKHSRYPDRDATLILTIYRHGLRASEACDLEWSQIDFDTATMHVRRLKNGKPATHPIRGDEMRALDAALPAARRGGHAESVEALATLLGRRLRPGDIVTVKGSHGSKLYELVAKLLATPSANFGPATSGAEG